MSDLLNEKHYIAKLTELDSQVIKLKAQLAARDQELDGLKEITSQIRGQFAEIHTKYLHTQKQLAARDAREEKIFEMGREDVEGMDFTWKYDTLAELKVDLEKEHK